MKWFVWSFVLYLIVEFGFLFFIAQRIGFFSLLGLMGLSATLGLFLLKKSKLAGLLSLRSQSKNHTLGLFELLWPVRFALVGVLLILPGFILDVFAVLLLLPIKGPKVKVPNPLKRQSMHTPNFSNEEDFQVNQTDKKPSAGEIIDVEYVKVTQKKPLD